LATASLGEQEARRAAGGTHALAAASALLGRPPAGRGPGSTARAARKERGAVLAARKGTHPECAVSAKGGSNGDPRDPTEHARRPRV